MLILPRYCRLSLAPTLVRPQMLTSPTYRLRSSSGDGPGRKSERGRFVGNSTLYRKFPVDSRPFPDPRRDIPLRSGRVEDRPTPFHPSLPSGPSYGDPLCAGSSAFGRWTFYVPRRSRPSPVLRELSGRERFLVNHWVNFGGP